MGPGLNPVEVGSLGVLNLKLLGFSFRARWLWLQRTADCCWSLSPEVHAIFDASIRVTLGDGRKALFRSDCWLHGESIQFTALDLYVAVDEGARRSHTVFDALADRAWIRDIRGPLNIARLASGRRASTGGAGSNRVKVD